jgi:signal transduction histidine kinase
MHLNNISLRWRILLFSAGSMLAIVGLLSYFGISAAQASTQQTLNERLVLAEQVAHGVDYNLQQALGQLGSVSSSDLANISANDPTSAKFLGDMRRLLPFNVSYIAVLDGSGMVVASDPWFNDLPGTRLTGDSGLQELIASNRATVSNAIYDDNIQAFVAYINAPLANQPSGTLARSLVAAIKLSSNSIGQLISLSGSGEGYLEIVDGNGTVVATTNPENILKQSDHKGMFSELIQRDQTVVSTCHNCHSASSNTTPSNEIITFAPLSMTTWGVVARQSEAQALATTRALQQRLIIFATIAVLIILPTIWFSTRSITGPINRLTLASRKIAGGSLDEAINLSGGDEIGKLAQSFETMRVKLKDSIAGIRQRTTELEGLNAIALTACQSLDLDDILKGALARVIQISNLEIGAILLRNKNSGRLVFRINQGFPQTYLDQFERGNNVDSVEYKVLAGGEAVFREDFQPEKTSALGLAALDGVATSACLPMRSKDVVVGVLSLASRAPRSFGTSDRQLLFSIANQMSMAIENARLYEDLRDKEEVLTELLKSSISAQEEERKRIARELHDETSQALTTLAIGLETISQSPPNDVTQLKSALKKNQDLIGRILDDVHRLILDLRPSVLDDLGLIPALEWYAENRLQPNGVGVHLETSGAERRLPSYIEVALFRIAQEAISNIAQYAKAEFVSVTLDFEPEAIRLTVEDDGVGFETGAMLHPRYGDKRGLGLLGMIERAETLGGSSTIKSQPGNGTQISVWIPLKKTEQGAAK